MKSPNIFALALAGVLVGPYVGAQTPTTAPPDNSRTNKMESSTENATADAQSNSPEDIDLTKRIRQSVLADKSLSVYAHNVKVVTNGGRVRLNGVVRSAEEKSAVEAKAADIAGQEKVTSDLKI